MAKRRDCDGQVIYLDDRQAPVRASWHSTRTAPLTAMQAAAQMAAGLAWEAPHISFLGLKHGGDGSVTMAISVHDQRFVFEGRPVSPEECTTALMGEEDG